MVDYGPIVALFRNAPEANYRMWDVCEYLMNALDYEDWRDGEFQRCYDMQTTTERWMDFCSHELEADNG